MRDIQTQDDLVELARSCQEQSRVTPASDAAAELRRMAKEYQRRAAQEPGVSHVARVENSRHAEIKDRVELCDDESCNRIGSRSPRCACSMIFFAIISVRGSLRSTKLRAAHVASKALVRALTASGSNARSQVFGRSASSR